MSKRNALTLGKGNLIVRGVIGGSISVVLSLLLIGLMAWLVVTERVDQSVMQFASCLIVLIAAVVGGYFGIRNCEKKPIIAILVSICMYMLMMLVVTAIFFDWKYSGVGVTFLVCAAGNLAAILLFANKRQKRSRKNRRYR